MHVFYQHSTDEFDRPVTLFLSTGRLRWPLILRILRGDIPYVRVWIAVDPHVPTSGFRDHFLPISKTVRRYMDAEERMKVGRYFDRVSYVSVVARSWWWAIIRWLTISFGSPRPSHGIVMLGHAEVSGGSWLLGGWKVGETSAKTEQHEGGSNAVG
jgi:hypothetical protein